MLIQRYCVLCLSLFGLSACAISSPFSGPQYSWRQGAALPADQSVIVVLTEAQLGDDPKARAVFWDNAKAVRKTLSDHVGFIGSSLRLDISGDRAWTMTVWTDAAAVQAFIESPAHQKAIRDAAPGLKGARFARMEIPAGDLPVDWKAAMAALDNSETGY